jgi:diacylglycerol kinase family enzyme
LFTAITYLGGFVITLNQTTPELFFITNLLAGGGKAHKRWNTFSDQLTGKNYRVNCRITEYQGHAVELARQAVEEGNKRIYVFGGDGTLNEVLNGVIENDILLDPDIELVFLSAGSSCDVERMFPVKSELIDRIKSERSYLVDVCKVTCRDNQENPIMRYFLVNSSIGVLSQSIDYFNQKRRFISFLKRLNIDIAALYAGLKNIFHFKNFDGEIAIDDTEHINRELKNITIFKCSYFGGGMNYGVESRFDDGKLHIALIGKMGRLRTLSYIPSLYSGTVLKKKRAEYHQANNVIVNLKKGNVVIETDGEIIGYPSCEYSLLPKFIKIII